MNDALDIINEKIDDWLCALSFTLVRYVEGVTGNSYAATEVTRIASMLLMAAQSEGSPSE